MIFYNFNNINNINNTLIFLAKLFIFTKIDFLIYNN